MAKKNGLSGLVARDQDAVTFSSPRSNILKKFGDKLSYTTKLAAAKLPGAATKALLVGVWVKQLKDIFSKEATALERVAVSTSLIPLAGCVTQSALEDEQGRNKIGNGIDTAACLVAYVAAFVPGGQIVSFVIHMARALIRVLENIVVPRDPPELAKTHYQYKWGWQEYFSNVEQTLRSDSFKGNLTAQLSAEKFDVIFMAGEAAGLIEATLEAAASNTTDGSEGAGFGDAATDPSKDDMKTDDSEVEDNEISDSQPFRRGNDNSSNLNQDPSNSSDAGKGNETDMQPQICQAYFERKERLLKSIGDNIETSLEDTFARYDEGFFNGYHPWLLQALASNPGPGSFSLYARRRTR